MISVIKNSWALMIGMLLLMLGNGLQGTLLGVRGSLEQIDTATMGYVMSAYFIGFLGGSRLTPLLLRRVGHVRVFAALGSLVSAAFILYAVFVHPIAWLLLRLLVGFCFSGIYVVAESWLNHSSSNETRGQALSLYMVVQMAGMVLGQLLLNLADPGGYDLFILITVLVSVSFAPILLSSSPAPMHTTARPMSTRELVKASPLACVGMFVLGGIYSAIYAMAPVYATERGFSIAQVSYFITAIYTGAMLFQIPIGWLSDRLDRRIMIISVSAVGALSALVASLYNSSFLFVTTAALIIGGMANPLYSLLLANANDFLEQDQMAAASGGLLFINGLGAMGGPVLIGYAMSKLGLNSFFQIILLLMGAICVYASYRMTQRATVQTEDLSPYLPLSSRSTAVATEFAIEAADESAQDAEEEADESLEDRL